jgi:arginase
MTPGAFGQARHERFAKSGISDWLHFDVDVLDEEVFPTTDYLMTGCIEMTQLEDLLRPLGQDAALIGVSIGCHNPQKDPDGSCGAALTDLVEDVSGGR